MARTCPPLKSLLFVPGARPDRFEKALGAGADAVCIDLEDAVPPPGKAEARAAVADFLGALKDPVCAVGFRINGLSTLNGFKDVAALAELSDRIDFLMIPKVEGAQELANLASALGDDGPPLVAIVESALGLSRAMEIAAAVGEAGGVLFGGADFSADIGAPLEWEPMAHARGALVVACAAAGAQLLDVPHLDVADEADLIASTERVKALGFSGRACIHPKQIDPMNKVFSPKDEDVARAKEVVAAFEAAEGGAALLNGKLIELPVIRSARRTLTQAGLG